MSGKGIRTKNKQARAPQVLVPVFVYGTLKRGFPLHEWIASETFVSEARLGGFTLLSLGPYPALVRTQDDENYEVAGELYEIDQSRFNQLRKMEERVGYRTEDVEVSLGGGITNTRMAKAFVFVELTPGAVKWEQDAAPKGRERMYPGRVVAA